MSTQKGVGRELLKICHVFVNSIILNKSSAHSCRWWKWEGHLLAIFCGCHKLVTSKTIIIISKKKNCLESKRVQYFENFNYKTKGNLIILPLSQISRATPSSGIYLFKDNNGTARTMCGICSKLTTIKMPERVQ